MDEELRRHVNAVKATFVEYLCETLIALSLFAAVATLGDGTVAAVSGLVLLLIVFYLAHKTWFFGSLSRMLTRIERNEDEIESREDAERRARFDRKPDDK